MQKAKDPEEAITEFRRLKVEDEPMEKHSEEEVKPSRKPVSEHIKPTPQQKKYTVAKGETELMQKLDNGWSLVQTLAEEKYLLKF